MSKNVESLALRNLLERVQAGKYVEWPWALLKDHFPARSDAEALKKMRAWAVKNRVSVDVQDHDMRVGRTHATVRVAVFTRREAAE